TIGGWHNDSLGNDHARVDQLDDDDGFGTVRLKLMVLKTGVAHQYKNATSGRELYSQGVGLNGCLRQTVLRFRYN
ncbi:hypothetical protein LTR56_024098, partial [Elasticomyces elasticus]